MAKKKPWKPMLPVTAVVNYCQAEPSLPVRPVVQTTVQRTIASGTAWSAAVREHARECPTEVVFTTEPVMHSKSGKPIMVGQGNEAIALQRTRMAEHAVPKAGPNYHEVFALYARCVQPANVSPRREHASPAEREQLRCALEGAPYVVKVGDRVTGMFSKREQALHVVTRMGTRATLYHVGAKYAWVEGATQVLPRSDRARGPSSVLAGQGTKIVRHKVVVGFDEQRIELVAAHRFDYDAKNDALVEHSSMNGAERKRDEFVTHKQWTRTTPRPDGHFDRTLGRWVFAA